MPDSSGFIFLSYARKDRAHINWLELNLAAAGHDVFIDREMELSVAWEATLRAKLADCKCVLVVWSAASVNSGSWVHEEIREAIKLNKPIIPVRISDVDIPQECAHLNAANLIEWEGNSQYSEWQKVLCALQTSGCTPSHALSRLPARLRSRAYDAANINQNQIRGESDVAFHAIKVASKEKYLDVISDLKNRKFVIVKADDGVAILEKSHRLNWALLLVLSLLAVVPGYIYYKLFQMRPRVETIKVLLIEPAAALAPMDRA